MFEAIAISMAVPYLSIPNMLLENNQELIFQGEVQQIEQQEKHQEFIVHN
jgi:hypothetical protein